MVFLTELLPESSSSSSTHLHDCRYDVFLSFRGVDTRNTFTDHLYNALLDAGIFTFLDDEEIDTGEQLKPELESAIQSSRASIIVLSKNYASSTWCLDELVLILDQKKNFNQIVIPIFYDVEPTDVRKQTSTFGEAMEKHKKEMEDETDEDKRSQLAQKMESWKGALTQVADLKGKDAKGRKETEFIKEVVTDIHRRLGVLLSNALPLLIGMDYDIKVIGSWLTDGSVHSADILTIVGMGGIGKTSLARYVFGLHSSKFHKSSFIEGINTRCEERSNGLLDLQKQLHGDISKKIELHVNDVPVYTSKIENALARKRVFIVLDDIGSLNQLDALLGNKGLHPGSKIIITTKDASLTESCALFNPEVQPKHKKVSLNGLHEFQSLKLLCIHAFKSQKPKEGYEEVAKKLVKYCDGHPLALQVLGESLHKRDVTYWEDCIKGLKKEPLSRIKKALHMSFESLPTENDKELFKHIACFFGGMDRDVTETILGACDINTRSGITILIDRCLLSIGWRNQLMMHQLIQDTGRDLVRHESPYKPWERTRLWCHEESLKVLKQKKGTENLLGLALDMRKLDNKKLRGSFELNTKSLSKMDNLMLLQLNYVQLNGCFDNFPEELRWLCMHGFPLKSVSLDLPMENLVALDMSYSNIESFDMLRDKLLLESLKVLDLSFCEQLHSVGGFSELPTLERLIVRKCISLIEVCESVEQCVELLYIDLSYCRKLKRVPISLGKLKKVKTLLLDGCALSESKIDSCDMNSSTITEAIPSDLNVFAISLPSSLVMLSLVNSNLSNESFPRDFSYLSMLEVLDLDGNPIVSMPNCVRTLPRLKVLSMSSCEKLSSIEHPPRMLKALYYNASVLKIKFDPEMSPLIILRLLDYSSYSSIEIDGMAKIQDMTNVEEKVLQSLGWTNLDFIKERRFVVYDRRGSPSERPTQMMYYEFGIFSMFYKGEGMPDWLEWRSEGPSISFTIPLSPKKLRGLNFCCTVECMRNSLIWDTLFLPMIKVSNITKNHTWIYKHYIEYMKLDGEYCGLSLLSHWMFGSNEMKGGDRITIIVAQILGGLEIAKECGVGLVYDEDGKNEEEEEEEDVLGYYKSWNHIIGGDLSAFQLTTGEYILDNVEFSRQTNVRESFLPFIDLEGGYNDVVFSEDRVRFKAFSQKKSEGYNRGYMTGYPTRSRSLQPTETHDRHIQTRSHKHVTHTSP